MSWTQWRRHFESQQGRDLPPVDAVGVPEEARPDLARSLAIFALGEAGEGKIAHQIERFDPPTIDPDWRASVRMWIREEGRHGRILNLAVKALGGRPATTNWTNDLLVVGRRLLGVRLKLLVVLTAEVVGITFYAILASRLATGSSIRAALEGIVVEEEEHLRFHARFFERETQSLWRWLVFVMAWAVVGVCAGLVVMLDHRKTLARLGVPKREAMSCFGRGLIDAARRVRGVAGTPRPWWAWSVFPAAFLVFLGITLATLGVLDPRVLFFAQADKVLHFLLYGGLSFGLVAWLHRTSPLRVMGYLTLFELCDEVSQAFISTRTCDVIDAVASVAGIVLLGLLATALTRRRLIVVSAV